MNFWGPNMTMLVSEANRLGWYRDSISPAAFGELLDGKLGTDVMHQYQMSPEEAADRWLRAMGISA
jgi:hypothetical protein